MAADTPGESFQSEFAAEVRKNYKPNEDLYTEVTGGVVEVFEMLFVEWGSWSMVGLVCEIKPRVIRRIRRGEQPVISLTVMDRALRWVSGVRVEDFVWYTVDELVDRGIWKAPVPFSVRGEEIRRRRKALRWKVRRLVRETSSDLKSHENRHSTR